MHVRVVSDAQVWLFYLFRATSFSIYKVSDFACNTLYVSCLLLAEIKNVPNADIKCQCLTHKVHTSRISHIFILHYQRMRDNSFVSITYSMPFRSCHYSMGVYSLRCIFIQSTMISFVFPCSRYWRLFLRTGLSQYHPSCT